MTLEFSIADRYESYARRFASVGNVDMANIYLHRWACEVEGDGIKGMVTGLRKACPYPSLAVSIGDPALFGGGEA